ncbi:YccV-like-domain-containing protein [Patellaria atrata CBS 101060]|uniref:YccV-like-domain-containing protein n=1 Tax=Patellaria atrata CBS 101060 TaxID=1346257 RepID=A0A9P4VPX4_9PEZI|nr:YccV-like-domain-containing protein [Patellaria atrata CBS 101060]
MASHSPLTALPDELLLEILSYLPSETLIAFQFTCKRGFALAREDILWRNLCLSRFKYWHPRHKIENRLLAPITETVWRDAFKLRCLQNKFTTETLKSMLSSQQGRIHKVESILYLGEDARETLLEFCNAADDVEDVLARRYYGNAVLGATRRQAAVEAWMKLDLDDDDCLEDMLIAYDTFVLGTRDTDGKYIRSTLDQLASGFLSEKSIDRETFDDIPTAEKARDLLQFLWAKGFRGVRDERNYGSLEHSFIGVTLQDPEHNSLPLTSVAIYCCVARRLGIDAYPLAGFPFHVYGAIHLPEVKRSSEYTPKDDIANDLMFIDPFRSPEPVPEQDIRAQLRHVGVATSEQNVIMRNRSILDLGYRIGINITRAVQNTRRAAQNPLHPSVEVDSIVDQESAFYCALWAMLFFFDGPEDTVAMERKRVLPYFLEEFQTHFPWDASLLRNHVSPLFQGRPEHYVLLQLVSALRTRDEKAPNVIRRDETTTGVKYYVGQLFRHKRYGYEGVITGWDPCCSANDEWVQQMQIDNLPGGRTQSFYHILADDRSVRYVAEENIELIDQEPSKSLMAIAGRQFKRWDKDRKVFVSNIRDEYPDD